MRAVAIIFTLLFLFHAGKAEPGIEGKDTTLKILDFIDLPCKWTGGDNGSWYLEFNETWVIPENLSGIGKRVESYTIHSTGQDTTLKGNTSISLESILPASISYEFTVLDPHSPGSDNVAFSEPRSMDQYARDIQEVLTQLVLKGSPSAKEYDLKNQLLSVWFHEEWFLDPATGQITKKVHGITPVIWQRRLTEAGEPVDEADTGYPVYYKNQLFRIDLRNW